MILSFFIGILTWRLRLRDLQGQQKLDRILDTSIDAVLAMQALRAAKQHNWAQVDVLLTQASQSSKRAHDVQTMLIGLDEGCGKIPVNLIMVHAQDHIMTSMLAREMIEELIEMHKLLANGAKA